MTEFKDIEQAAYTPDQDPNRLAYERAVVERMKESGFLEIEIRTECLTRCGDGYNDEIINAGWHYWQEGAKAAISCRPAIDAAKYLDEIRNGTRDGFVSKDGDPQGIDPELACPCCGGSGHKDDATVTSDGGTSTDASAASQKAYAHATRIAETYINGEYEAKGCAAQMIFDELRILSRGTAPTSETAQ